MVQKRTKPKKPGAEKRDVKKPAIPEPGAGGALPAKRRGRPRAYRPEEALAKALAVFRRDGFAATSLDSLSAATGMNRPSLYGAFGDKRALYIKSYQRSRDDARTWLADILRQDMPIRERLARLYAVAIDMYLSGSDGPNGCFTVMTAASGAVADPEIRAIVLDALGELDEMFAGCFRIAIDKGELPPGADPRMLGKIASAVLHMLAVRSRVGMPRPELEKIVRAAIDLICGPGK